MNWNQYLFLVSFITFAPIAFGCQPANDGGSSIIRRFCVKYSLTDYSYNLTTGTLRDPYNNLGFKKAIQYDLLRLMVLKGTNTQGYSSKVECYRSANPIDPRANYIQPVLYIKGNTTMDRLRQTLVDYSYMSLPDDTWYKIQSDNINVAEVQQEDNCCGTVFP